MLIISLRYIGQAEVKSEGIAYKSEVTIREITHCGLFKNGYLDGPQWHFLHGGNFQFGIVDSEAHMTNIFNFTSKNGAYLNQNKKSGFFGKFLDGKMLEGQSVTVESLEYIHDIVVPKFSSPSGYKYKHFATQHGVLNEGHIQDPLEEKFVYVNDSAVHGKGLFAKIDISVDTIFAYSGGFVYDTQSWNNTDFYAPRYLTKFKDAKTDYYVHIPDELGDDLSSYKATLGHKINHSFLANCGFVATNHPRFGMIAAAKSFYEIKRGEEILCNYNLQFHEADPWYQEMWRIEVDLDTPEGPYGHREHKKPEGQPIQPMLVDSDLYKEFTKFAISELKLSPLT